MHLTSCTIGFLEPSYIMTHKQVLKKLPLVNNNIIFSFDDDYKVVGGREEDHFFLC